MNTLVIGIAGGTGSGKTTLSNRLKERFGDNVCIMYHDNYYKCHDDMSLEERSKLNYDHPEAFDKLFISDIQKLKAGQSVQCPVYDYTVHNRTGRTELVRPAKVIIVEGIWSGRTRVRT